MPKQEEKPGPTALTPQEKAAIRQLRELEKSWPKSLWLFSAAGQLCVMKKNAEGEQAVHPFRDGGIDQAFIVATIKIENDGGDW